jgi:hypothetical protein
MKKSLLRGRQVWSCLDPLHGSIPLAQGVDILESLKSNKRALMEKLDIQSGIDPDSVLGSIAIQVALDN